VIDKQTRRDPIVENALFAFLFVYVSFSNATPAWWLNPTHSKFFKRAPACASPFHHFHSTSRLPRLFVLVAVVGCCRWLLSLFFSL
jgi:hypothetical protein